MNVFRSCMINRGSAYGFQLKFTGGLSRSTDDPLVTSQFLQKG